MPRAIIKYRGRIIPITKNFTLIGRDNNCDIIVNNDSVSKKHAFIVREDDHFYRLHDFKSVNGISVKGRRREFVNLSRGLEFELGSEVLEFGLEPTEDDPSLEVPALVPTTSGPILNISEENFRFSIERDIQEILQDRVTRRDDPYHKLLILYKVSGIVNSMVQTDELLTEILRLAQEVMDADRGFIMLVTPDGRLVPQARASRDRTQPPDDDSVVPISQSIAQSCFESGDAILTNDTLSDSRFATSKSIVTYDIRSAMAVPLEFKGTRLGVLYLDNRLSSNVFTDSDIDLLRAFAAQASVALENAILYKNLRESLGQIQNQREMLIQSEKMAAMGQLAAGVAHEIRNPLTAISGYIQMYFQRCSEDAPFYRQMGVMHQAVNQIRGVLEGLLGFARKSENRRELVSMNELIERTLALAHHTLSRYNQVQVVKRYQEDLPPVQADPRQMQQVFLNFMINAAQAMPQGGTLTIITKAVRDPAAGSQPPDRVMAIFSDTGHGIPEDKQPQIFQPFFTSGKQDGVGLGLTISKTILENHGGSIRFESVEGKGTSFFIQLPSARA